VGIARRTASVFVLRPAKFHRHVLPLDAAGLPQALTKCRHEIDAGFRRAGVQIPDHRQRRLLRTCGERPRCSGTANKSDEFPPPHAIKSGVGDVGQNSMREYYQNLSKVTAAKSI